MPAPHHFKARRVHLTISEDDYQWMQETLGPSETISDLFRQVLRKLRGEKARTPARSATEILGTMDDLKREARP